MSSTSLRQESTGEMETKCIILLWLHILVLIPFDISSVDSSIANNIDIPANGPTPLVLRIIGFSKDYLSSAGPMRRIAALVLSRLLTRPDMPQAFASFLEWSHEVILSATENVDTFRLLGVMEALASIFKVGSRNILFTVSGSTWNDTSTLIKSTSATRSSLLRKFIMKLSQRVGLACIPQRSASWRYEIRTTIFGKNISTATATSHSFNGDEYDERNLELEDMDIPEIIEEIIELLLSGLRDSDTIVRWSAAKGIGRITACLTSSLSEDVLASILELFSAGEGDGSWHGGCLALAELARRGLLLPSSLSRVVPVIARALHYDIRRGPHSVGSHVRDAAAYVCWAFGRVYSNWDMKPILEKLAPHLLTIACYDREVNCRRAAAAAFQENVGRQGIFPHGIEIVNTADYFTLASRTNSYLHVAVSIAQYKEYIYPFAEELMLHKICHWDKGLRELASVALSALSKYDLEYFGTYVLEKLLPCTLSQDLCTRHGATLAAGEIVLKLHESQFTLSVEMQKSLSGVVPAIEKARLYRGKGGEIMRASVSRFIECISLARVRVTEKTRQILLETLNENLRHPNAQIQEAAANALKQFVPAYLVGLGDKFAEVLTLKYVRLLKDSNPAVKRGSASAIGILPFSYIAPRWRDVLPKLSSACLIQDNPDDNDAEARVNSVHSLVAVCETLTNARNTLLDDPEEESALFLHIKSQVMQTLFKALEDYAVDNRGDIGSWVREAAIFGLEKCAYILCRKDSQVLSNIEITTMPSDALDCASLSKNGACCLFDNIMATSLIGGIAKQAVEKLDKIREVAAKTLQRILHDQRCIVTPIPYKESLQKIIPNIEDYKWGVATVSYPCFVELLQFPCYSKSVLSGLVISVGGLQDSLRKASLAALLDYIASSDTETEGKQSDREFVLSSGLIWILQHYQKLDRVIIPTLKTIEILFSNKLLLYMKHNRDFCTSLLDSLVIELKSTKDFSKLYTGLSLLGYMTLVPGAVSQKAFSLLLSYLGHRYPKIRKATADQVYLVILQNADLVSQEANEVALEILMETCWEGDIEEAKSQRSKLLVMAGMESGSNTAGSKTVNKERANASSDENVSYSSLVGFSGF